MLRIAEHNYGGNDYCDRRIIRAITNLRDDQELSKRLTFPLIDQLLEVGQEMRMSPMEFYVSSMHNYIEAEGRVLHIQGDITC